MNLSLKAVVFKTVVHGIDGKKCQSGIGGLDLCMLLSIFRPDSCMQPLAGADVLCRVSEGQIHKLQVPRLPRVY